MLFQYFLALKLYTFYHFLLTGIILRLKLHLDKKKSLKQFDFPDASETFLIITFKFYKDSSNTLTMKNIVSQHV